MRFKTVLIICFIAMLAGCLATTNHSRLPFENPSLDRFNSDRLEKFGSTAAFRSYLRGVERISEAEYRRLYAERPILLAQLGSETQTLTDECLDEECLDEDEARRQDSVTVTASKASNPSITNNQEAGVEEGDIVKQIDDFLIVLQDGRLFSINTKPGGFDGLDLTGRHDVYVSSEVDTWYDEMLVSGRRIVITGYSYDAEASEVTIFSLNPDGSFTHEDTFYISSDDYYDSDNYATRIVGDKFIIHTPIYLSGYDASDPLPWPVVRHWQRYIEYGDFNNWDELPSNPLLKPRDIYRPLQSTISPVVHTITVCDIGAHHSGKMMDCDATAFVAPEGYEFYVSTTDVYLWTWPDGDDWDQRWDRDIANCETRGRADRNDALPATIYKVPIRGRNPEAMKAFGRPFDQFSMVSQNNEFHALIDWADPWCSDYSENYYPALFSASLRAFSASPTRARGKFEELPKFSADNSLQNRFIGEMLVYSTSNDWGHYPPRPGEEMEPADISVVPVNDPEESVSLTTPHSVIRLESLGLDAVVTGYLDDAGLSISAISLGMEPEVASSIVLQNRFESEGRSHAFNAIVYPQGSALMGIPTVMRPEGAGRWWWNSESSDVSFLKTEQQLELSNLGALRASGASEHELYECDVSCIDWYGNSRPIFTSGRIFALSGTEIVEGQIKNGAITEKRRVNLTEPVKGSS